jgi:hypothetical protein
MSFPPKPHAHFLKAVLLVSATCLLGTKTAKTQVVNPPLASWISPGQSHPLGKGSLSGTTLQSTNPGSLALNAGQIADNGFFLHQETNAGRELIARVSATTTPPSTGTFGLMVRDSLEADAPFLFLGRKANGELVIYLRQKKGAPTAVVPLANQAGSPIMDHLDLRLLVGGSTVYAFSSDARFVSYDTNANWHFLAAYSLPLDGADYGGAYIDVGLAALSELHHTAPDIWSESTTTADQLNISETSLWSRIPVSDLPTGAAPVSKKILRRPLSPTGGTTEPLSIPITAYSSGDYHPIFHCANSSSAPVSVEIVKGTNIIATGTVEQDTTPASWHRIGNTPIALNAGETLTFRVYGGTGQNGEVHMDAVRLFRTQRNDVKSANWVLQGNKTGLLNTNNTVSAIVYRTSDVNETWDSSGAYSSQALIGNGVVHFKVPRKTERVMFGLAESPGGMSYTTILYRFFANNDGKSSVNSEPTPDVIYSSATTFSIERIGSQILFRRDGNIIKVSTRPSTLPLYLDCSIRDHLGRVGLAKIYGIFSVPSGTTDKDSDGFADSQEQLIIDADTDDEINSIYDVLMSETIGSNGKYSWRTDPDQDGLTNAQELASNTNPTLADTDSDGLTDGAEVNLHDTDPTLRDTDGDGLSDGMEVNSPLDFKPLQWSTLVNGVSNGVSDRVRWDIMHADPANYPTLASVLPNGDYDLDGVFNIHEGEDGTSAIDIEDYFQEVAFDRLFGSHVGSAASVDINNGVESSRLLRAAAVPNPAAGISHHEAGDGTRVRFQFLPLNTTSGTGDQVIVGFTHRGHPPFGAIPEANYAVAIRRETSGKARLLFYGSEVVGAPVFDVSDSDLVELRLATGPNGAAPRTLQVEVNQSAVFPAPITLPAGAGGFDGFTWDHDKKESTAQVPAPLALVVHLPGDGAGVHNLRYRRVHDPDRDNDQLPDRWEQQILDAYPQFGDAAAVLPGGDADNDELLNHEEYELGTDPAEADTDSDGMPDGWEVDHGLDPKNPADGTEAIGANGKPVADKDGDGLSNLEEYRYGSRPDQVSTMQDGFSDFWKHRWELDPLVAIAAGDDDDDDGLTNEEEHTHGTDPNEADTDLDGFEDGWEIENGFDPHHDDRNTDSDNDGLLNTEELAEGTDPLNPDSDADDLKDGEEVHDLLTDPLDHDTDGDGLPDGWEVAGLVMHFGYQTHPGEPIVRDRTYGSWELMSVEEFEPVEGDTPLIQTWERNVYQYDWYYNSTFTLRDVPLVRHLTRLADGTIVEPEDGWVHDTTTNTLIRPYQVTKWTVEYDETLRLWVGVHQTPQQISTWWWVFTNPLSDDTDEDGLPDGWEYQHWLNPDRAADAGENPDNDGLINSGEFTRGTHPWREDTDGDALTDGHEVTVTLSDPLNPSDPGTTGGATPPVKPVTKPANRVEFLVVQPAPAASGTGVVPRPAPTISGHGGRPPGGPGTTPPPPPAPHPITGPLQTQPGSTAPNPLAAPPSEELYVEFRTQHKLVIGSDEDNCGGDDDGSDWEWDEETKQYVRISEPELPTPGGDPKWIGRVSHRIGGNLDERNSAEFDSADEARNFLDLQPIDHETDWEKSSAKSLANAQVKAPGRRMNSQAMEVRLVRKTGPESYASVNVEVRKQFLRVARKRQLPAPPSPDEGWIVERVDSLELVIPVGESKSVDDNQRPIEANVLNTPMGGMTNCWEYQVMLVPAEFVGQPYNGFDDTVTPRWQSAPENGDSRTVYFATSAPDLFEFKTANPGVASVTPAAPGDGRIPLEIRGGARGETELQVILKQNGQVATTMMIDVLPRIEKTLTVWTITNTEPRKITVDNGTLTGWFPGLDPGDVPSAQQVETYLNDHWGRVANVHFTVQRKDGFSHYDRPLGGTPPDGMLGNSESPFVQVDHRAESHNTTDDDKNLYFVKLMKDPTTLGWTRKGAAFIYVRTHAPSQLSSDDLLQTVAHEVGHAIGRGGHVDDEDKEALMNATALGGKEIRRSDRQQIHEHESNN